METQVEKEDDFIILDMSYNPVKGECKMDYKVKV